MCDMSRLAVVWGLVVAVTVGMWLGSPSVGWAESNRDDVSDLQVFAKHHMKSEYGGDYQATLSEVETVDGGTPDDVERMEFELAPISSCVVFRANFQGDSEEELLLVVRPIPTATWTQYMFLFRPGGDGAQMPEFMEDAPDVNLDLVATAEITSKNKPIEVEVGRSTSKETWNVRIRRRTTSTYVVHELAIDEFRDGEAREIFSAVTMHYDWKHYGQGDPDLHGGQHLDIGEEQAYRVVQEPTFEETKGDFATIRVDREEQIVSKVDDKQRAAYPVDQVISRETQRWEWNAQARKYEKAEDSSSEGEGDEDEPAKDDADSNESGGED